MLDRPPHIQDGETCNPDVVLAVWYFIHPSSVSETDRWLRTINIGGFAAVTEAAMSNLSGAALTEAQMDDMMSAFPDKVFKIVQRPGAWEGEGEPVGGR